MKITDVKPWVIEMDWDLRPGDDGPGDLTRRQFVFVKVATDEGITGWGEITTYPGHVANRVAHRFVGELREDLVGQDPTEIESIWNQIFRNMTYLGTRGATTAAISGIDIALWDILGKSLDRPIFRLLGGPVRDRIALYTHPPEPQEPIQAAEDAKRIVASGHRAFKMDPMSHSLPSGGDRYVDGEISAQGEVDAVEITAAVREAVGPQIEILIDAHGNFNVPTAMRLANKLAP